jgi:predicted  nucleic acid-binding Zn-ribbon protein
MNDVLMEIEWSLTDLQNWLSDLQDSITRLNEELAGVELNLREAQQAADAMGNALRRASEPGNGHAPSDSPDDRSADDL